MIMSYDLYQKCGSCINGFITVDGESVPCQSCEGTGKLIVGDIPNLEVAIGTLTSMLDNLTGVCGKILKIVGK
jgi:hypothetical protein